MKTCKTLRTVPGIAYVSLLIVVSKSLISPCLWETGSPPEFLVRFIYNNFKVLDWNEIANVGWYNNYE